MSMKIELNYCFARKKEIVLAQQIQSIPMSINDFIEMTIRSPDKSGIKNFEEIALSRTVSEINAFLSFTQKFKMATKTARK